jgi:hypothetical protein
MPRQSGMQNLKRNIFFLMAITPLTTELLQKYSDYNIALVSFESHTIYICQSLDEKSFLV